MAEVLENSVGPFNTPVWKKAWIEYYTDIVRKSVLLVSLC